jgi:hypothetical protein
LQTTQGLPAIPSSAQGPAIKANFASGAPPADPNVATEINRQLQAADQSEKEVVTQAAPDSAGPQQVAGAIAPPPAPAAEPIQISAGMSIDAVTAALGSPARIVDLGPKKIYFYKDMKITFKDGVVADVQ